MRESARSRASSLASASFRSSSAYPRMEVSGVRSSCEASARKLRSRSSDRARSANAVSIWVSMPFSARPSRPTSLAPSAGCNRRVRSPAAIASASIVMSSRGRSPRRMSRLITIASAMRTATDAASSMFRWDVMVASTELSGVATMRVPPGSEVACSRYSGPDRTLEGTSTDVESGRYGW